jgi:hypothetical protein
MHTHSKIKKRERKKNPLIDSLQQILEDMRKVRINLTHRLDWWSEKEKENRIHAREGTLRLYTDSSHCQNPHHAQHRRARCLIFFSHGLMASWLLMTRSLVHALY